MTIIGDLKIVPNDNIILRSRNEPITVFDDELIIVVEEMKEAMEIYGGIGLAAPQIGINKQIFVWEWGFDRKEVINPVLELDGGLTDALTEGCLSIPDSTYDVIRNEKVHLSGFDAHGEPINLTAIGHLARIFQHEIDHLNSRLINDFSVHYRHKTV